MSIKISLSDDFDEMFLEIIEKSKFNDRAEIISNAIALLDLVCEAKEFGLEIAMINSKGEVEDFIQGF